MSVPLLALDDVRKRYGKAVALDGVSLAIGRGEVFGLLGPNGAGKTTLLSILAGLLAPDGGGVRLLGEPFDPRDRDRRRLIGLGTQDLAVYPELSARENLDFFARLYGLGDAKRRSRADELLDAVGLLDRAGDRVSSFSGGMKRRLNLAAAVVHEPILLLLDEPTTGVDPQSRNLIYDMVRKLNAGGMTVVYTSHYMEEVQALCARVAIIDGGKLLALDHLDRLLRTLPAVVRFKAARAEKLESPLRDSSGIAAVEVHADAVELRGPDLEPLLLGAARACIAAGVEPRHLQAIAPTLEGVFLHLTGRGLRD